MAAQNSIGCTGWKDHVWLKYLGQSLSCEHKTLIKDNSESLFARIQGFSALHHEISQK